VTSPFLAPERDQSFRFGRAKTGTTYYTLLGGSAALPSTLSLANADRVIYVPVWVDVPVVIDQIAGEITAAEGSNNIRYGLYRADRDAQPIGAPLIDSGDIACTSNGVKTYTPGTPVYLPRGGYLQALNGSTAATTIRVWRGWRGNPADTTLGTSTISYGYVAQTYGAFPTPGDAWTTVATSSTGAWFHPFVFRVLA
jgi:hypothetical protein